MHPDARNGGLFKDMPALACLGEGLNTAGYFWIGARVQPELLAVNTTNDEQVTVNRNWEGSGCCGGCVWQIRQPGPSALWIVAVSIAQVSIRFEVR